VDFSADYLDYMAEFARRYEGEIIQSDRPARIFCSTRCPSASSPASCLEFPLLSHRPQDGPRAAHRQHHRHQAQQRNPNNASNSPTWCQSSLPKGVFNLVSGAGSVIGKPGLSSRVAWSRSPAVSRRSRRHARRRRQRHQGLARAGGKAPAIVMGDATSISPFALSAPPHHQHRPGLQLCERVYVHESVAASSSPK